MVELRTSRRGQRHSSHPVSTPHHAESLYHPTPRPARLSGRSCGSVPDEAERWRGRAKGVTGNVSAMRTITAQAQHLAPVVLLRQDERATSAIDDHVTRRGGGEAGAGRG